MLITVSTKGQVVIPKALRVAMGLSAGTPLEIEATPQGLLLRPVTKKGTITMAEFLAMPLPYEGPPLTDAEIAAALEADMRERAT